MELTYYFSLVMDLLRETQMIGWLFVALVLAALWPVTKLVEKLMPLSGKAETDQAMERLKASKAAEHDYPEYRSMR